MAVYKVLQDIESEDKLIGPLSFRQCIYAGIAAICFYLTFLLITKHAAFVSPVFVLPGLFCAFFAIPWSRQQPTEVWALAKIRFFFKPRRRIWNQSGVKELVTVTAPKRQEVHYTDGLSQIEVKSRLEALANTIDSRGWAVKNVNVNMFAQPTFLNNGNSDRLLDVSSIPVDVPNYDVQAADDILDERNNPIAQQFDQMISASTQAHRQQLLEEVRAAASAQTAAQAAPQPQTDQPADYWFLSQPGGTQSAHNMQADLVSPAQTNDNTPATQQSSDDATLSQQIKANHSASSQSYSHLRTIQPMGVQPPQAPAPVEEPKAPVTAQPDPAILELASNNDLNVATIARQAQKRSSEPPDEVVISLR